MVPEQLSSDIETTTDDKQQLQSIEDQALTELMDESSSDRGDDTEQMSLLTAEEEVELAMCIEAGVLACERLAADTSELSGEDIADLGELIRLGEDAYTRMLASNQGLVRKYANYTTVLACPSMISFRKGTLALYGRYRSLIISWAISFLRMRANV